MIYIFSRFLQRGENYAAERGLGPSTYRVKSQPETSMGLRFTPNDQIVVVGDITNALQNVIDISLAKSIDPQPIERVFL